MPACCMPITEEWPDSCNANLYEQPSDAAGYHADDEDLLQGATEEITIVSLSLGVTRTFSIKGKHRHRGK